MVYVVIHGLGDLHIERFQLFGCFSGLDPNAVRDSEGSRALVRNHRANFSGSGFGLAPGRIRLPDALALNHAGNLKRGLATGVFDG